MWTDPRPFLEYTMNMAGDTSFAVSSQGETDLAFAEVFESYRQPIHNYLLGMTQNTAEAEDLTQETFIRVSNSLSTFRGEASLSTWLYRIARNVFIDHTRRASTRQARASLPLEDLVATKEAARTPEQLASRSEMSECVQDFIRNLPENYRTVLVLADLQGLSNREIADVLDCSLDTVKIRLHRARAKLRASLNLGCDLNYDEYNVLGCERKADDLPRPDITC